ncbi:MAG: imidazole glycerol phosphate synthase subunit HisF [Cohaesibacteraceae bacterium]|nr:imidazole glycerol phosphate synthase subunit HisF [Cohaesibacteraceae bacterium]MBL4875335.1 imidazole glycerol phosphate synthase subunit HisF [Cohaesibacteraceae bacterium]
MKGQNLRIIARLDVKPPNLIKGVQLEGFRKLGDPNDFALKYYNQGIDELIYMDCVASLYGRNSLADVVRHTADNVFIPVTVGGGIRTADDVAHMLDSGADKIAINTAAILNPVLIDDISRKFGSQCIVLSIEAKFTGNSWEALHDNGREKTGRDVIDWVREATDRGAGEILLTSVDCEGTAKGFDIDLVAAVSDVVQVPVIASGGMGNETHLKELLKKTEPNAVAMAHVLHYNKLTLDDIRTIAANCGRSVRQP